MSATHVGAARPRARLSLPASTFRAARTSRIALMRLGRMSMKGRQSGELERGSIVARIANRLPSVGFSHVLARAYGHGATVAPYAVQLATAVRDLARDPAPGELRALPWSTRVGAAPAGSPGAVRLRGELYLAPAEASIERGAPAPALRGAERARSAIVLVHGLGGDARSHYMVRMAQAAAQAGFDALTISLRGADGMTPDIYHAGQSSDVLDVLRALALGAPGRPARYEQLFLVGFSLGGHLALRAATEEGARDLPLRAVCAVCSPLDLAPAADALDEPSRAPYRRFIMAYLKAHYARVARTRPMPLDVRDVASIATFRAWDERITTPYFGFASVDAYYAEASVGARLEHLAAPALLVAARHDPMIGPESIVPAAERAGSGLGSRLTVRLAERGGHLVFPSDLDVGEAGPRGLVGQVLAFLCKHAR